MCSLALDVILPFQTNDGGDAAQERAGYHLLRGRVPFCSIAGLWLLMTRAGGRAATIAGRPRLKTQAILAPCAD